jgi:hypothetical protein
MTKVRAILRAVGAVASFMVAALMRLAKRSAGPGAGPKIASG